MLNSVQQWSSFNAVLITISTLLHFYFGSSWILPLSFSLSIALLWFSQRAHLSSYAFFAGTANWVTLFRLFILLIAVVNTHKLPPLAAFGLYTIAVWFDVIDGIIARKLNESSTFGQYFDMEVDAFFVLAMGVYFIETTGLGYWLLIPGLLRYVYKLSIDLLPALQEKRQKYAANLAGLNFVVLLISILLPEPIQLYALIVSTIIVVYSFSIAYYHLFLYVLHDKFLQHR